MLAVRAALCSLPEAADYDQAKPDGSYDSHTAAFLWGEDLGEIAVDRHRLQ